MKKIYLSLMLISALTIVSSAQTVVFSDGFESWNTTGPLPTPNNWMGSKTNIVSDSVLRVTAGAYSGTNAVKLLRRTSQNRRFTSQPFAISQGTIYQIKFFAQGKGDIYSGLWTAKSGSTFGYQSDGTYETVNNTPPTTTSSSWWIYTDYVMADTSNNNAELVFWIRNTISANGDLSLDEVSVTTTTPLTKSIYDIQYSTAVSGDSPEKNKLVSTTGIVTAKSTFGYFIQDGSGAWNGLYVDDRNNTSINLGDNVTIIGVIKESFGQTVLTSVLQKTINSSGNALPAAIWLPTNDVKQEKYEGVLVQVGNAACTALANQYNEWTVDDGSGAVKINDVFFLYTPVLNNRYDITGPVEYSFSEYKILPRNANDVSAATSIHSLTSGAGWNLYPNPNNGNFNIITSKSGNAEVRMYDVLGKLVYYKRYENISGNISMNMNHLPKGIYLVQLQTTEGINTQKIIIE